MFLKIEFPPPQIIRFYLLPSAFYRLSSTFIAPPNSFLFVKILTTPVHFGMVLHRY